MPGKKTWIIHPFLAAVYPIIFLYSHNVEEVLVAQALQPGAISLLLTGLILLVLWLILRDGRKAGVITTALVVLFFSYGHVVESLKERGLGRPASANNLVILWALLFIVVLILTSRSRGDLTGLTSILNVMASVMVFLALVGIVTYRAETRDIWKELDRIDRRVRRAATAKIRFRGPLPDIYYIILDSYPNNATLKDVFGYDNSSFTDYLAGKGFNVATDSRSNYVLTYLSLASSLNMEYVNYLSDKVKAKKRYSAVPYQMVKNNLAAQFLRGLGYRFVHFQSGWSGTARNRYADMQVWTGGDNEFAMMLVQTSMLRLAEKRFGFIRGDERQRRLTAFARLAEIPYRKDPTFSFAHMVFPHPPYFFTAQGKPIVSSKYSWGGTGWAERDKYRDQLIFANKKVKQAIDKILERSERPPIIIIQGDHGPASSFYLEGNGRWENPTNRQLSERTGILNAYYFQGKKIELPRDISPVNSFRLFFKTVFGADYKLLPDKVFYSHYNDPYRFSDVTARLKR